MAQNLFAYCRMAEEEIFVELFCDMEQLEPDHEPRVFEDDPHGSNAWGILPPRSYFRFDRESIETERLQLEAQQGLRSPRGCTSTDYIMYTSDEAPPRRAAQG